MQTSIDVQMMELLQDLGNEPAFVFNVQTDKLTEARAMFVLALCQGYSARARHIIKQLNQWSEEVNAQHQGRINQRNQADTPGGSDRNG